MTASVADGPPARQGSAGHPSSGHEPPPAVLKGIGLSALGYGLFAVQDATVKWLVGTYPVSEILLVRSLVIIAVSLAIGRGASLRDVRDSGRWLALLTRAALILAAWLSYYTAARQLGLAELTTLYFAAPIVAVTLAVVVLRERVDGVRLGAVGLGFLGVVLAADPHGTATLTPVLLALLAACCWGTSVVLVRLINRAVSTVSQMLVTNAIFALACAALVVPAWRTPDGPGLLLMLGLGVAGGLGQFFLYEGFRFAPASAVAPVEYSGLVWAFVFGFAIWGDVPGWRVFAGAAVIAGASLFLVLAERRRAAR